LFSALVLQRIWHAAALVAFCEVISPFLGIVGCFGGSAEQPGGLEALFHIVFDGLGHQFLK
jgi:hypothetical protein